MKSNTIVHNERDHAFYIECTSFINKIQLKQLMSFLKTISHQSWFGFYEYGSSCRYTDQSSTGSRLLKMYMMPKDEERFIETFGDYIIKQKQMVD